MEKDFGKAEQHLDTAAAILKSSNSNISRNLQLYLFYLFWRTGEKEKSKEAALRYIAPTLPGKDRRIREIKSNLRWLQQNFHGTG
jgi:hypothetical protein